MYARRYVLLIVIWKSNLSIKYMPEINNGIAFFKRNSYIVYIKDDRIPG